MSPFSRHQLKHLRACICCVNLSPLLNIIINQRNHDDVKFVVCIFKRLGHRSLSLSLSFYVAIVCMCQCVHTSIHPCDCGCIFTIISLCYAENKINISRYYILFSIWCRQYFFFSLKKSKLKCQYYICIYLYSGVCSRAAAAIARSHENFSGSD